MGFDTDDPRIPDALTIAKDSGMMINFIEMDEERSHPNTAIIHMVDGEKELTIEGISIGGGKIEIVALNGFSIAISGNYPALLVFHQDTFGTIAKVTQIIGEHEINVGQMQVARKERGELALMTCELDDSISEEVIQQIQACDGVVTVTLMSEA